MTVYVAYVPIYGPAESSPSKGLMKRRFQVRDFVSGRGRLLAEFLDATGPGLPESVVLREARRFCREHDAVLLVAAGGPLRVEAAAAGRGKPAGDETRSPLPAGQRRVRRPAVP